MRPQGQHWVGVAYSMSVLVEDDQKEGEEAEEKEGEQGQEKEETPVAEPLEVQVRGVVMLRRGSRRRTVMHFTVATFAIQAYLSRPCPLAPD